MLLGSIRRRTHGQALPEYALLLILIAVVSIIVLIVLSMAVIRGYALLAGVFGVQKTINSGGTDGLEISQADCYYVVATHEIQFIVSLNVQNVAASDILISTPNNAVLTTPLVTNSPTSYSQTTTISNGKKSDCPLTVVVQAKRLTAIKSVTVADF